MRYLQFAIYLICIAAGFFFRRSGQLKPAQATRLSWWVGWVIYPCMAFSSVTSTFTRETLISHWPLPVVEFGIMAFGAVVAWVMLRLPPKRSSREAGTFGFNMAIGNYVFLPLPLVIFLWGKEDAANVIVASLGAEVAFWTIGAAFLSEGQFRLQKFFTPAVISLIIGFAVVLVENPSLNTFVEYLNVPLSRVGAFTIPLAMFLLGFHLAGALRSRWLQRDVAIITLFRALVVPAVFLALVSFWNTSWEIRRTLFLVSAMPVAVASVYMSDLFHGDPEMAARCVLLGHLVSLVSVPAWLWLFSVVFHL